MYQSRSPIHGMWIGPLGIECQELELQFVVTLRREFYLRSRQRPRKTPYVALLQIVVPVPDIRFPGA
ncbi:hypothetical protein NDU88_008150 [Pleurodeles waltl]|uniref:Uncharacterized protein n=1 Tax=Pleurodeles waltl TaxID=8319 RepID=A0AAV7N5R0_PLEWA|nr:hypothetical protein NDU88_008150 [Pleurodeles waltl]